MTISVHITNFFRVSQYYVLQYNSYNFCDIDEAGIHTGKENLLTLAFSFFF